MCTRGPARTPVETAKAQLTKLHDKKNVQRNDNFAYVVNFVNEKLDEDTTLEQLNKWRENWRHTTDSLGKKSGVVEFNQILDTLAPKLKKEVVLDQVEVEQAPPPVTFSKPLGTGSDDIMQVAELIDESNRANKPSKNCCIL